MASTGEFEQLGRYVNRKLMEMGRGILEGEIAPNPMEDGKQSACDLCIYSSVCGFDRKLPEIFKTRKVSVTKEEAWAYMTGEEASEPEGNRRPAEPSGEEEPERTAARRDRRDSDRGGSGQEEDRRNSDQGDSGRRNAFRKEAGEAAGIRKNRNEGRRKDRWR